MSGVGMLPYRHRHRYRDRHRLVGVAVLAASVLAACSSDSKGAADTSAPTVPSVESTTTQRSTTSTNAVATTSTASIATSASTTTTPATTEPATTATTVTPTTGTATTVPATTVPPTTATTAPTTAVPVTTIASDAGPLEFVDGKLLGIAQGTELAFATAALGVTPVRLNDVEFDPPVIGCTGTPDPWVIRTGGLTLVFESLPGEEPILSNWTYTGGPVAGFTEIIAPNGIRIGDPRSAVEAANPGFLDLIDQIDVNEPFYLRYDVENDVVNWFGIVDCLFETEGEGG